MSFPIPLLRLKSKYFNNCVDKDKVIFYCHYPDKLLSTNRSNFIMKFYRFFLDKLEEITTAMANLIIVNSKFTMGVFYENFRIIT